MNNSLGEGIYFDSISNFIYWVDINEDKVYRKKITDDYAQEKDVLSSPSCILKVEGDDVTLLDNNGIMTLNWITNKASYISINEDLKSDKLLRSNDGVILPDGRIIYGIMHYTPRANSGGLYVFDGSTHTKFDSMGIPNTFIVFEDSIFISDSDTQTIYKYNLSNLNEKAIWLQIPKFEGTPDGGCIGPNGNLYIAKWGAAKITEYSYEGELIADFHVNALQPTNCTFIDKHILVVTTASENLTAEDKEKYSQSGELITIRV